VKSQQLHLAMRRLPSATRWPALAIEPLRSVIASPGCATKRLAATASTGGPAGGAERGHAGDREHSAGDREDAAGDREDAAGDREDAAGDREHAAEDRHEAAQSCEP